MKRGRNVESTDKHNASLQDFHAFIKGYAQHNLKKTQQQQQSILDIVRLGIVFERSHDQNASSSLNKSDSEILSSLSSLLDSSLPMNDSTIAPYHLSLLDVNDNKLPSPLSRSDSPIHMEEEDELNRLIDSVFGDQYPLLSPYLKEVNGVQLPSSLSRLDSPIHM